MTNKVLAGICAVVIAAIVIAGVAGLVNRSGDESQPSGAYALVDYNVGGTSIQCAALAVAMMDGDAERVQAYLDDGADINAPLTMRIPDQPEFQSYALCLGASAVAMNDSESDFIAFLLERGADPNAIVTRRYSFDGEETTETPLALAATAKLAKGVQRSLMVRMLLEAGADPNINLETRKVMNFLRAMYRRESDPEDAAVIGLLEEYGV